MAELSILNSQSSICSPRSLAPLDPLVPLESPRALTRVGVRKTGKQKTHSK